MKTWLCIGCGHRKVRRHATYCDKCRERLENGEECLDQDDLLTKRECRAWIKQLAGVN